jgi:hypothetical protein
VPLVAKLVEMSAGIRSSPKAPGVSINHIFGPLDLDPAPGYHPDDDLVAGGQPRVFEDPDWEGHLVLARDLAHRFTILANSKGGYR